MAWLIWAVLTPLTYAAGPDYVRVKPGADLYSLRELASGERGGSWMPWNSWREHCRTTGTRAERLVDQNGITGLKIDIRQSGCGYLFRTFDEDFEHVFVKSDQVEPDDGDDRTEAGVREPDCPECRDKADPMDAYSKIAFAAMTNSEFGNRRQPEKTAPELETYLSCYAIQHGDDYQRLYRRLVDVVGRAAQVTYQPESQKVEFMRSPEQLQAKLAREKGVFWMYAKPSALKCVTLRESRFDPGARGAKTKSGASALGLGQQMPVAVKQMDCALHGCVLKGRKVNPKPWVQGIWAQVFKDARRRFSPAEYRELMTNAVTGQPCLETMEVQERDAACPINSLATLAVAQLEGALTVRRADARHDGTDVGDYGGQQAFDLTVVTASSNLVGTGNTREAVASTADTTRWTRALAAVSKSREVGGNTAALVNCLQGGNFKPPWTMKPGEKARDCRHLRTADAE